MAILELTANPNSILPGMVVIVTATLTSRVLFRHESIYITMLRSRGLEYRHDPVAVALSRTGVRAVMTRQVVTATREARVAELERLLDGPAEWVVLSDEDGIRAVVDAEQLSQMMAGLAADADPESTGVSPQQGRRCVPVRIHATLREALDAMNADNADVAVITGSSKRDSGRVYGILTRAQIHASVRYGG